MHVALGRVSGDERVELLLHPQHVQRGDAQDLGLAALEQRRAVHPGQHLRPRRTAAGCRPARGRRCGRSSLSDPLPDQLLGQRPERARRSPSRGPRTARPASPRPASLTRSVSASRSLLAGDGQRLGELVADGGVDGRRRRRPGSRGRAGTRAVGFAACAATLLLRLAERLDERLGRLEPLGDDLLGRRRRAAAGSATRPRVLGVDSASTIMIATSPSSSTRPATTMSKVASSSWVWVGNADPLALDQRDPDAADRAGERQAGQLGRQRARR